MIGWSALRKSKFAILVALVAAGCMTANENSTCEETVKTVTIRDTVTVVKRDTLRLRDTVTLTKRDTVVRRDTLKIHDTTKITIRDTIIKRDTLRIHDTVKVTVRDTMRIIQKDTVVVRDTVKILANATDPAELVGVWDGLSGTQKATLSFTEGIAYVDFSGNLNGVAVTGYIKSLLNGQAKVVHAGFKDVTWLLSLDGGVLTIEEIGTKMFAGPTAALKKR